MYDWMFSYTKKIDVASLFTIFVIKFTIFFNPRLIISPLEINDSVHNFLIRGILEKVTSWTFASLNRSDFFFFHHFEHFSKYGILLVDSIFKWQKMIANVS